MLTNLLCRRCWGDHICGKSENHWQEEAGQISSPEEDKLLRITQLWQNGPKGLTRHNNREGTQSQGLNRRCHDLQIFKLAQGEYVAVERVEANYKKLPIIAQMFAYGNSMESMLVAVVVPEEQLLLDAAKKEGIPGSYTELLRNQKTKDMLLKQMNVVADESRMQVCMTEKVVCTQPYPVLWNLNIDKAHMTFWTDYWDMHSPSNCTETLEVLLAVATALLCSMRDTVEHLPAAEAHFLRLPGDPFKWFVYTTPIDLHTFHALNCIMKTWILLCT